MPSDTKRIYMFSSFGGNSIYFELTFRWDYQTCAKHRLLEMFFIKNMKKTSISTICFTYAQYKARSLHSRFKRIHIVPESRVILGSMLFLVVLHPWDYYHDASENDQHSKYIFLPNLRLESENLRTKQTHQACNISSTTHVYAHINPHWNPIQNSYVTLSHHG